MLLNFELINRKSESKQSTTIGSNSFTVEIQKLKGLFDLLSSASQSLQKRQVSIVFKRLQKKGGVFQFDCILL